MKLIVINHDGVNVGMSDCFAETWLEFNEYDAILIANHWNEWMLK